MHFFQNMENTYFPILKKASIKSHVQFYPSLRSQGGVLPRHLVLRPLADSLFRGATRIGGFRCDFMEASSKVPFRIFSELAPFNAVLTPFNAV